MRDLSFLLKFVLFAFLFFHGFSLPVGLWPNSFSGCKRPCMTWPHPSPFQASSFTSLEAADPAVLKYLGLSVKAVPSFPLFFPSFHLATSPISLLTLSSDVTAYGQTYTRLNSVPAFLQQILCSFLLETQPTILLLLISPLTGSFLRSYFTYCWTSECLLRTQWNGPLPKGFLYYP